MTTAQSGADTIQNPTDNLLSTLPNTNLDRITKFAAMIFKCSVSSISFFDGQKVFSLSSFGVSKREYQITDAVEKSVYESKTMQCHYDLSEEEGYKNIYDVSSGTIKFFAGYPISLQSTQGVYVFYIADRMPRNINEASRKAFEDLAHWVGSEIKLLFNQSNKVERELTQKVRELAAEKAKTEAMLYSIGDGVIGIDDGGKITFTNEQAKKLTGFSDTDLMGNYLIHCLRAVDAKGNEIESMGRPIRNALYSNKTIRVNNVFYVRKDGSKFPTSITATPISLYGSVVGGVNVFRDITKEYEVDRMKTEFISLASHQLRTPLSAMKWFSEMLLDGDAGELSGEQKELLDNIYKSNERMIQLVNTLLNISRIESGRIIIDPQPTDIVQLVNEVIVEVRPRMDEKKQNFALSAHHNLPQINVDPKLVRHVYMNLLTNAIKYTPEGGDITVIISKSGNELISQVADSGYGIPKNEQEKVFSKFFRAKNIVKKETDGTGLGLYLTKAIVDSSGGKIWYKSDEGKGTTFWFILPLFGSHKQEGEVSLDS